MNLGFKKSKKKLVSFNYLELTPIKMLREEIGNDGLVSILIPKFNNTFAIKYILPKLKSPDFKIKLDDIGSQTWVLMDGEKNVSAISEKLLEKFGEKIYPVNERLTAFLTQLYKQRFISFKEIKEKGD
jgi:hypothetical protein